MFKSKTVNEDVCFGFFAQLKKYDPLIRYEEGTDCNVDR